jgi:hypothetical protein
LVLYFFPLPNHRPVLQEIFLSVLALASASIFFYLCIAIGGTSPAVANEIFSQKWLVWTEFTISIILAADVIFHFCSAPSLFVFKFSLETSRFHPHKQYIRRFAFVLQLSTIADLVSILPGIVGAFQGQCQWFFMYLRALRLIRSLRFLRDWGWAPLQGPFPFSWVNTTIPLDLKLILLA